MARYIYYAKVFYLQLWYNNALEKYTNWLEEQQKAYKSFEIVDTNIVDVGNREQRMVINYKIKLEDIKKSEIKSYKYEWVNSL